MEMGMLLAAIGRSRVAILKKGHLEVPSDAHDILYIPFNDHVRETVPKLVGRLTSAGFQLDPLAITKASS
jgi:predicted nucleotide-binding protein